MSRGGLGPKPVAVLELEPQHVVGFNRRAITEAVKADPAGCQQTHAVRDMRGLESCLGGIFFQTSAQGYANLPLERMAGLLLHRIAEGQFFLDGNKRTALLSAVFFMHNNGFRVRIDEPRVEDLLWGFALDPTLNPPRRRYSEADAIQYFFDNVLPRP